MATETDSNGPHRGESVHEIDSQSFFAGDPMETLCVRHHGEFDRLTRYRLQETLMLMGCRPRDAVVVSREVFGLLDNPRKLDAEGALPWHVLHQCIYSTLARLDYCKPHHLLDFRVATEITQRRQSFVVLLGGTSGTGKSTLASLLAARLRLSTVLPTDSVRHILRTFTSKQEQPSVFVSTYQAGDALSTQELAELAANESGSNAAKAEARLLKKKTVKGYKMQSRAVLDKLDQLLTSFEERKQSLVVEGVHLDMEEMTELVSKHPNCVPFLIYISNELKHRERFAVRARHMTIDPQTNKYIKHFDNIRHIQHHLTKHADHVLIPKVDNTNVDRSLATIQSTLVRVLGRLDKGERVVDPKINKMVLLSREHENATKKAWSSKGMRRAMRPLIKQKVSKRLLLRRLLAEQSSSVVGGTNDNDESSSSDDERPSTSESRREDDLEEEEDEVTTVVGSLFSGAGPNESRPAVNHAASASSMPPSPRKHVFLDEIEENAAGSADIAKMRRALSAAVQQAALWRESRQCGSDTAWRELVPPSEGPEATFSDVIENLQSQSSFHDAHLNWRLDDRRKSWIAGDGAVTDRPLVSRATVIGTMPTSSIFKAFAKQRTDNRSKLKRGNSLEREKPKNTERRRKAASQGVEVLQLDELDVAGSDYDIDSISVNAADRDSQTSSQREYVSPLDESMDGTDSHFEVSSMSSTDD